MMNKISRRTFLKCAGVSAAAVGAAGLLGGCSDSNASMNVEVGDQVSNWNNLRLTLSSLFVLDTPAEDPAYQYVAVLATVQNRSSVQTFSIGAQNIVEIDAAYPVPPEENVAPYFHALAAATTDFAMSCDGQPVEGGAYIYLYDSDTETFSDSPTLPPAGSGYIELLCLLPVGWQELTVVYTPTFVEDRTLTFVMSSDELTEVTA